MKGGCLVNNAWILPCCIISVKWRASQTSIVEQGSEESPKQVALERLNYTRRAVELS
jgi:hypothetical protein